MPPAAPPGTVFAQLRASSWKSLDRDTQWQARILVVSRFGCLPVLSQHVSVKNQGDLWRPLLYPLFDLAQWLLGDNGTIPVAASDQVRGHSSNRLHCCCTSSFPAQTKSFRNLLEDKFAYQHTEWDKAMRSNLTFNPIQTRSHLYGAITINIQFMGLRSMLVGNI